MKRVVLITTAAVFTATIISCKNEVPQIESEISSSEINVEAPTSEIAMATPSDLTTNAESEITYLYVTAPSGLSLREHSNLHSEKLGRMPYGTKVKVLKAETDATMNVSGVKGGMNQVEFNHKKGFAFNGYLSKYFPPERDISVKGYGTDLHEAFPSVIFTEEKGGTATKPSNTAGISLPDAQWHEAYIIAQRLFDFPKEFEFPNPKGKKTETIFDGKPKKGVWTSQLEVTRKDDELEKIEYVYRSKGFGSTVSISKEGDVMKISRVETIE